MPSVEDLMTTVVVLVGLAGLVLTAMIARAAARDHDRSVGGQARRRARWGAAAVTSLVAVGAAGIAFMRTVTL
jgi:hypothetical protein